MRRRAARLETLAASLSDLGFFDKPSKAKLAALRDDHGLESDADAFLIALTLLTEFGTPKTGVINHDHRFRARPGRA